MALKIPSRGWWETDSYTINSMTPEVDPELLGPQGMAVVRVYENGSTQQGWGLTGKDGGDGFMPRYLRREFHPRKTEVVYDAGKNAAALVMRSMRLVCIDIDGKNGGLQGIHQLGGLPYTLAETSKSGTGYHLFYATEETWDPELGFGLIPDHIGIVPGVDIRGVGCVYHHDSQRWNGRYVTPLPDWLRDRLLQKKQLRAAAAANIQKTLTTLDETEILVMQTELIDELNKPIPSGKRNNTLFAIGSKMKLAEVPDWDQLVKTRAMDIGLASGEAEKLVHNIENYGGTP